MIAEVIPRLRLIRSLGFFDYLIPEDMRIVVGDVVRIPWRGSFCIGVVKKIKKTSDVTSKLKSVDRVLLSGAINQDFLNALDWFSAFYYISPALGLRTWLPDIPRREIFSTTDKARKNFTAAPVTGISILRKDVQRITAAVDRVLEKKSKRPLLIDYLRTEHKLAFYRGLLQKSQGTVLIITPSRSAALYYGQLFADFSPLILDRELSMRDYWTRWVLARQPSKHRQLIIGTKSALFSLPFDLTLVIIDDEDSVHHKNYDQNPRFSVHDIALFLHKKFHSKLVFTSRAPRITTAYRADWLSLSDPGQKMLPISLIDMHSERMAKNYSVFSEAAQQILATRRCFVFINRTGFARYLVCSDCKHLYPYGEVLRCTHCRSTRLYKAGFGTQKIVSELGKLFPKKRVDVLDRTMKLATSVASADIVVGTEFAFDRLRLADFDACIILGVDQMLSRPQWRAFEKAYQLLAFLAADAKQVLVQTHDPEHAVFQLVKNRDYKGFYDQECHRRQLFRYPPFTRLVKALYKDGRKSELFRDPEPDWQPPAGALVDIDPDDVF